MKGGSTAQEVEAVSVISIWNTGSMASDENNSVVVALIHSLPILTLPSCKILSALENNSI